MSVVADSEARDDVEVGGRSGVVLGTLNMGYNAVSGRSGGASTTFTVSGSDNTLDIATANFAAFDGASSRFRVLGSDNVLKISSLNIGTKGGGVSEFSLAGSGNSLAVGGLKMLGGGVGNADFSISGSGNSLAVTHLFSAGENNIALSGRASASFGGVGNTFEIGKTSNESGITVALSSLADSGSENRFEYTGASNALYANRIFMGGNTPRSGEAGVYIKGDVSGDERIRLFTDNLYIKSSANSAATVKTGIEIAGNAILRGFDGGDSDASKISLSDDGAMNGGSASVKISGSGNDLLFSSISVGHTASTAAATFTIKDSGSIILATGALNIRGGSGTSFEGQMGGMLEFMAGSAGFSTLEVSEVQSFTGLLLVDFTLLAAGDGKTPLTLISSGSAWEGIYDGILDENRVKLLFADGADARIAYEDGNLVAYYAAVPEPAAFAVFLGLSALALGAFRRRFVRF